MMYGGIGILGKAPVNQCEPKKIVLFKKAKSGILRIVLPGSI